MIIAALCVVMGGVTFEKVDIPDVHASPGYPPLGTIKLDLLHADLDKDGHSDLILPTRAYLRPGGRLDPDRYLPMPDVPRQSRADIWESTVYVLSPGLFATYVLEAGDWKRSAQFALDWEPTEDIRVEVDENTPSITFERFLHDVDGDGQPEIVRITDDGISVSAMKTDGIETAVLALFPPHRAQPSARKNALWPASERKVAFPNRWARFNVVIDGGSAVVIEQVFRGQDEVIYAVHRYQIVSDSDKGFAFRQETSYRTEALPDDMEPIALNADGDVDYAGYRYERPTYTNWKPVVQRFVSTDAGKTFEIAVTRGFLSRTTFVDLDGDGDLDWLGEESGLVSGGVRETANRALFQQKFSHAIMARTQNDDGSFDRKWRTLGRFTIELDKPARHYTYRFWQYMNGDLIDCTGDFNGDDWRDALVFNKPEAVSIHLGGADGFTARPETEFAVPPHKIPCAFDVDGDGLSDVVVRDRAKGGGVEIHLNQGDAR